ncbi:MAG TPA: DUF4402 domain-containing protein [Gemmatimonadaceae bacterium]|nr:DUF4402 domain-containing protein [Gemmatimonadaceae bacterium]
MRIASALCAGLLVLWTGARSLEGQTTNTVNASAVLGVQLRVRGLSDLDFGTVVAGTNKTVNIQAPPADATPGQFSIDGEKNATVLLAFNFPAVLLSASGKTLAIGSWTGCQSTSNSVASCTPFVFGTPLNLRPNNGKLWVWLGATVSAPITQAAGSYSGTVQMTVLYTGL